MSRRLGPALGFLAVTRLVLNMAHRMVYPFLPVIARGLGVSLGQAGVLVSVRSLAGIATPVVVRLAGRAERRRTLIAAGLALFVFGALLTAMTGVFVGALVGLAMMGLAKATYDTASIAYLADRVPYAKRARYLAIIELTWAGGFLVGAPLAGWLISRSGWQAPFWVFGLAGLAAIAAARFFLDADSAARTVVAPLHLDRSATAVLVVVGLYSLAHEVVLVGLGAWLESGLGLTLAAIAFVAIVFGIAELVGESATLAFTDVIGKRRSILLGLAIAGTSWALLVVAATSTLWGVLFFAVSVLGFEYSIVSTFPLASEVRPGARTRYLSLTLVAVSIGRAIGAIVGPALFTAYGFRANTAVAALLALASAAIVVGYVREGGDAHVSDAAPVVRG